MQLKAGDKVYCQGYKGTVTNFYSMDLIEVNWGRFTSNVGFEDIKLIITVKAVLS